MAVRLPVEFGFFTACKGQKKDGRKKNEKRGQKLHTVDLIWVISPSNVSHMFSDLFQFKYIDTKTLSDVTGEVPGASRTYTRVPYEGSVLMSTRRSQFYLPLLDISLLGIRGRVSSTASWAGELALNRIVDITLPKPVAHTGVDMTIQGKIVWREEGLVGIEFLNLDIGALNVLKNIILRRANNREQVMKELVRLISTRYRAGSGLKYRAL